MTSRRHRPARTAWQKTAVRQLRAVAVALPDDFQLLGPPEMTDSGAVLARIRLKTADLIREPGGLPLLDAEEFILLIGPGPLSPPHVWVDHDRFLGHPHVLQGMRLCIYLAQAREWDPSRGFTSVLDRLTDWLADAAAGRFDPSTALYHAVGGVIHHQTSGVPTVVVRTSGRPVKGQAGFLTRRSEHRLDLHYERTKPEQEQVPVIALPASLPLGAGTDFHLLVRRLDDPLSGGWFSARPRTNPESPGFLTALAAAASRNRNDAPQPFVLTVPHPTGGPPHLLAGRIPPDAANRLRRLVRDRKSVLIDIDIDIDPDSIDPATKVEWCPVSDERPSVNTRRDADRPVNGFQNKTVHVWGCGGLGSWIAEFVARAGARRIVLCDPGAVAGGLLVRQNFTELDVGNGKADALRDRLLAIRDDIAVESFSGETPEDLVKVMATADVIIDATISIAIGQLLDAWSVSTPRPLLSQVATDVRTGTLGILTVSASPRREGPNSIDQRTGSIVTADGELEAFHTFWIDVAAKDELIPTRGCSVPTFYGSAADMAAVAASLTTLLGSHVSATEPVSGTHLIALPHSPTGPRHRFILAT